MFGISEWPSGPTRAVPAPERRPANGAAAAQCNLHNTQLLIGEPALLASQWSRPSARHETHSARPRGASTGCCELEMVPMVVELPTGVSSAVYGSAMPALQQAASSPRRAMPPGIAHRGDRGIPLLSSDDAVIGE